MPGPDSRPNLIASWHEPTSLVKNTLPRAIQMKQEFGYQIKNLLYLAGDQDIIRNAGKMFVQAINRSEGIPLTGVFGPSESGLPVFLYNRSLILAIPLSRHVLKQGWGSKFEVMALVSDGVTGTLYVDAINRIVNDVSDTIEDIYDSPRIPSLRY